MATISSIRVLTRRVIARHASNRRAADLLPILDPAFNLREIAKQMILLEDHLFQPRKRCEDCIHKHLLTIEALAEEAVTLDSERKYLNISEPLAEKARELKRLLDAGEPPDMVAQRIRETRKKLVELTSGMKLAKDERVAATGDLKRIQREILDITSVLQQMEWGAPSKNDPHKREQMRERLDQLVIQRDLHRILGFLTDLGISAHFEDDMLFINRTSMVEFFPRLDENDAYDATLKAIREELPDYRVYWSIRSDEQMGIQLHPRHRRSAFPTQRVASRWLAHGTTQVFDHHGRMVQARTEPLTPGMVQQWRKDFLQLVSNTDRVQDIETALKLKQALLRWRELLESYGKQITLDLNGRTRVNKNLPEWQQKADPKWAQWYLDHMKPFWDLVYEITRYPVVNSHYVRKYSPWMTDEKRLEQLRVDSPKWAARVKLKAQAAWRFLNDFVAWTGKGGLYGGGEEPVSLTTVEEEQITLEGFRLIFRGFADSSMSDYLESFKAGLRTYRQLAGKRLPILLKTQLPIVVNWKWLDDRDAGSYKQDRIEMSPWGLSSEPRRVAHVLAHEMGHHVYRTVLSSDAQSFWHTAIHGDFKDLDLRDAIRVMKGLGVTTSIDDKLAQTEPILYLQLNTLLHSTAYKALDLWSVDSISQYLDAGNNPIVRVPTSPITGYSGKNSEEAFCEAVGMLVAYGPRTVSARALDWLRVILPDVRIARNNAPKERRNILDVTWARVAARYMEAEGRYKSKKKVETQDGDEMVVYEYSERQVALRNKAKAERVEKLRKSIDKLRQRVRKDLMAGL